MGYALSKKRDGKSTSKGLAQKLVSRTNASYREEARTLTDSYLSQRLNLPPEILRLAFQIKGRP